MSDSLEQSWSNSSNPPVAQAPDSPYLMDKLYFAGNSTAAVLYGIVTALFFQCMVALFNPSNRRGSRGIKWGLVVHTAAMFSIVTVFTGMALNVLSISHIDNRGFPGNNSFVPGPIGYKLLIYGNAIHLIPNLALQLNQWLADGLLLYRCYVIYAMNRRVVAIPCLLYLTSFATGIASYYETLLPKNRTTWTTMAAAFNDSYYAVSFSLNLLLTSMIIARLILQRRNIRSAMGASAGGLLYGTIITILVESSALYAVSFLLFFVPSAADSVVYHTFWSSLVEVQVIAPFLIIQRIASRRALTSEVIVAGDPVSIHFKSLGEPTYCSRSLDGGGSPTTLTYADEEISRELGDGVEITIDKFTS